MTTPRRQGKPLRQALCAAGLVVSGIAHAAAERPVGGNGAPLPLSTRPAAGLYDAQLCVAVNAAPAQCGPVTVDIGEAGQALVRISDIAYRLQIYGEQLGVTLFHGAMQIDGFFASYRWNGGLLNFVDPDKNTRYELKVGTRRFDTP